MEKTKTEKQLFKYTPTVTNTLYALFILVILLVIIASVTKVNEGDIPIYQYYAQLLHLGHLPYTKSFALEYPPGVIPIILAAFIVGELFNSYLIGYLMVSVIATGIFLGHRYLKGGRLELFIASILLVPLLQFNFYELDVFAALALYFSICFLKRGFFKSSALLLAAATLIKAYPAVCLIGILFSMPKKDIAKYLVVFFGSILIVIGPIAIIDPHGLWYALSYHTGRPLEFESSGATIGYILHTFGNSIQIISSHKSLSLSFRGESIVNAISTMGLLLSLILGTLWVKLKKPHNKPVILSLIFLLIFILFFKVGSPQYFIPVIFLITLLSDEVRHGIRRKALELCLLIELCAWLLFVFVFNMGQASISKYALVTTALAIAKLVFIVLLILTLCRNLSSRYQPLENKGARIN